MKHKLLLFTLLLIAFADVAVARSPVDKNNAPAASQLSAPRKELSVVSVNKLPFKNLQDSSKWSTLPHGRALTASLRKKKAHGSPAQDYCLDCGDLLFGGDGGGGDLVGPLITLNGNEKAGGGGGGCGWTCCFQQCMSSAMTGTGSLCVGNCTACGVTGSAWACAICVGCGTVGFAAIEFCTLHCCVNPGCPAG